MADNYALDENLTIATDDIGGVHHQRVKMQHGVDGIATDVSGTDPMPTSEEPLDGRFKVYNDANFVTGDSPATLDVNTGLGRNGISSIIVCDGPGDFTVEISNDGATYSDAWIMHSGETLQIGGLSIDSIRFTWVADSAYRTMVY